MAQRSKKDQIAEAALPLFLEHGVKGTSIDMVVKSARVSKPTVYNHFPDKANLFYHTLALWLTGQPEPGFKARSEKGLLSELAKTWLNQDALRFYGLLMGEGFRVPDAKQKFSQSYDLLWRNSLTRWAEQYDLDQETLSNQVNSIIIQALL
ncbi:MAG: TetR/AcrR family transcriptional regulator [Reinekea sp.]|jgi:TetR/AcrR family transcriptional regulator, regulator of autoinduction and epiphytic fitness